MNSTSKSRKDRILITLVAVFIPPLEVFLFLYVCRFLGTGVTVGLVVLSTIVGLLLWRRWYDRLRIRDEQLRLQYGQIDKIPPTLAIMSYADFGGALLAFVCFLAPGFITDAVGFVVAVPAVRHWYTQRLEESFRKQAADEGLSLDEFFEAFRESERKEKELANSE